jgi:hypothetical protein
MTNNNTNFLAKVAIGFAVAGMGIFLYQCYLYLLVGEWHSISMLSVMKYIGIAWALHPQSWIGLHKILDFLPLALTNKYRWPALGASTQNIARRLG